MKYAIMMDLGHGHGFIRLFDDELEAIAHLSNMKDAGDNAYLQYRIVQINFDY